MGVQTSMFVFAYVAGSLTSALSSLSEALQPEHINMTAGLWQKHRERH